MKILVTGSDPFGGESINPAIETVKKLPDVIAGAEIIKLEIPNFYFPLNKTLTNGYTLGIIILALL